mgnify:CR=1 FL=1
MRKNTIDEFGNESGSTAERQEQKKKRLKTPDNIEFGDMPPEFRMRFKKMLERERKK